MSAGHVRLPNSLIIDRAAEIGPYGLSVLCALAVHARGANGGKCFPSIETLVEITGISRRYVISQIQRLEGMGLVTVAREGRKNVYTVILTGANDDTIGATTGANKDTIGANKDTIGANNSTRQVQITASPISTPKEATTEATFKHPNGGGRGGDFFLSKDEQAELLTQRYLDTSTNVNRQGEPAETAVQLRPKFRDLLETVAYDTIAQEIEIRPKSDYVFKLINRLSASPRKEKRDGRKYEFSE